MAISKFRPGCHGCEHYRTYNSDNRYCLYGKKRKRFSKDSARVYCPKWCPRYLYYPDVRVYPQTPEGHVHALAFSDAAPREYHYYLRYQGRCSITVSQYNKIAKPRRDMSMEIGTYVGWRDVVVLFDGIRSYAFFHGEKKVDYLYHFDTSACKDGPMPLKGS